MAEKRENSSDVARRHFDVTDGSGNVDERPHTREQQSPDVTKRRFDAPQDTSHSEYRQGSDSSGSVATSKNAAKPDTVANHVLGDQPAATAQEDRLGFAPYVAAVAEFLIDPSTKVPLTLSVEGLWGSGKSSFMLQLQEALRKRGKTRIVSFNAWQYDADEGLWAAFINEFDTKLNQTLTWSERIRARFRLVALRVSWQESIQTIKALLWLAASLFATGAILWYLFHGGIDVFKASLTAGKGSEAVTKTLAVLGGTGGTVGALLIFLNQLRDLIKSPASLDNAARFFSKPNYSGKLPLIHQITEDFNRLVRAYAGNDDVYVFIDDLDRCEYSKAAELMQALLMLLSSAPKIALIIGLDREKVAAAMATKQEKLLPYLYGLQPAEIYKHGLAYGQNFIEKFIQLSYILPTPGPDNMKAMVNPDIEAAASPVPNSQKSMRAIEIVTGKNDSHTLNRLIDMADQVFDHNPRNVKQFVNMFRLQAFIANETGLFGSDRVSRAGLPLTIPQLGKFVTLCIRWPNFVAAASNDLDLVGRIEKRKAYTPDDTSASLDSSYWKGDRQLMLLLAYGIEEFGKEYSLADINFQKLNEIVPGRAKGAVGPTSVESATGATADGVRPISQSEEPNPASETIGSEEATDDRPEGVRTASDFVRKPGSGGRAAPSTWGKTPGTPSQALRPSPTEKLPT